MQTVIYIIGAGNSGSTLLSMALGAHSQAISVGELSRIDQFRSLDMDCSCGERLSACPFWKNIPTNTTIAPFKPVASTYQLLRGAGWGKLLSQDAHALKTIERNLEEYQAIAEHSRKSIIVDSSKDLTRLAYLYRSGKIRIVPIYMVRDGRAYIDSMKRRDFSAIWAMPRWIRKNKEAARVFKLLRAKDRGIWLDYDEFTKEPEAVLKHICAVAGIKFEKAMLDYHTQTFHNIAGTRTRLEPRPIQPHMAWKERISLLDKLIFALIGGPYFNRRFGIGKKLISPEDTAAVDTAKKAEKPKKAA